MFHLIAFRCDAEAASCDDRVLLAEFHGLSQGHHVSVAGRMFRRIDLCTPNSVFAE